MPALDQGMLSYLWEGKTENHDRIARELCRTIPGWVFESWQMKSGMGGLKGIELKKNLLEVLMFIRRFQEDKN